jgi:hypothetical protein
MLPLAGKYLTPADGKAVNKAFRQDRDPLIGVIGGDDLEFGRLLTEIVNLVPAPLGVGVSSR